VETDTYDADGEVVQSKKVGIDRETVEQELLKFCGTIAQVPPMYSAIKQGGQPLYKLARRGIDVPRQPRRAVIHHIELTDWSPPEFTFEVTCSAGTYVRSLAHDLGQELGCGAHLTTLVRTASGQLQLEDAVQLSDLTSDNWQGRLHPMEVAVQHLPALTVDEAEYQALIYGQSTPHRPEHPVADLVCAFTAEGRFFALIKPTEDGLDWRPHKVFID